MLHFTLIFLRVFFLTLLLDSLLSLNFLLRHSGTSPSTMQCLSRPPPLLPVSSIFLLHHHCHFCSFSFVLVIRLRLSCGSSCWNFGFPVMKNLPLTTRSLSLFTSSYPFFTTAHSRCDEFFVFHFCISSSTSSSTSWYLLNLRDPS